jgi:predicted RND superfamily exporter protein
MKPIIIRWSTFVIEKRWPVIIICIIITLVALFGFKRLCFYNKFSSWLSPDDPDLALFLNISEKFSINDLVVVMVKPDGELFSPDMLKTIRQFTETLQEHEEIFYVSSIANIADIKKIPGGIQVDDLLSEIPPTPREMSRFKSRVLPDESFVGNIVSADGKWAAISVFINSQSDSEKVVKNLLEPAAAKIFSGKARVYYSGMPSDAHFITDFAMKDLMTLTPIIFVIICFTLFISFRSLKGILYPALVVALATVWLFGLIGFLNQPMSFVTSVIPVLLTALGSAYGIHVLNKYYHDLSDAPTAEKSSLIRSTSMIIAPVLLAGLTTFIGFLSFQSVKLKLIAEFGLYSSVGILFSLLIALTLVPALSSFGSFSRKKYRPLNLTPLLTRLAALVIRRKTVIVGVSFIILTAFAFGIPLIKKEMNFSEYFPDHSLPRISQQHLSAHFEGAYPVIIDFKAKDCKSPGILRVMRRSENFLMSQKALSLPVSIVSVIEELNFKLNDRYSLPDSSAGINNIWFFMDGRREIKQIVTENNQESLVFSKSARSATAFNRQLTVRINRFIAENYSRPLYVYKLDHIPNQLRKEIQGH